MMHISVKDAKQLCCKTRDEFVEAVISLQEERDELLEALQDMLHIMEQHEQLSGCDSSIGDAARAAIAKAIGKSSTPVNDTVKLHRAGSFGGAE